MIAMHSRCNLSERTRPAPSIEHIHRTGLNDRVAGERYNRIRYRVSELVWSFNNKRLRSRAMLQRREPRHGTTGS
jgi:hypothetical protein